MDNISCSILLYFLILCIIFMNTHIINNCYFAFNIIAIIIYCIISSVYSYFNII